MSVNRQDDVQPTPKMLEFLVAALNAKATAIAAGERAGKFDCPKCRGPAQFILKGSRSHMHAACQDPNCLSVIE